MEKQEIVEAIQKEIENYTLIEHIPGGKSYLIDFVSSHLLQGYSAKKNAAGALELFEDERPVELKRVMQSVLSDFIDHKKAAELEANELAELISTQSSVKDRQKKVDEEKAKNNAYNPYEYSHAHAMAKKAAAANAEMLKRMK